MRAPETVRPSILAFLKSERLFQRKFCSNDFFYEKAKIEGRKISGVLNIFTNLNFLRVISHIDVRKAINSQGRGVGVASRREVEKLRKVPAKLAFSPHV